MKSKLLIFVALLTSLSVAAQRDTVHWFPDFPVKCLRPGWEKQLVGQTINDSKPTDLLERFFPGTFDESRNFVGEDEDPASLRMWSCPDCPPIRFTPMLAESDTDYIIFPFERHLTQLIEDDTFHSKTGDTYRLLSFSTSIDYPPTGRWEYGLLGLALLREQGEGSWVVLDFEPAFDMNGMYMTAAAPQEMPFAQNGNLLFRLREPYPCGPPVYDYYPCFSDLAFYAFYEGKLLKVLLVPDASCANFGDPKAKGSAWTTEVNFAASQAAFPDIIIRKTGNILLNDDAYDYLLKSFPSSFVSGLRKGKNRRFQYTIRYSFRNGRYEKAEESIQ